LADALRGLDVPVTVVCSRDDARDINWPANVTVLTDVPYARYRELLEGASAVIVPLETHTYSSGQVVILEAMALGKAVIVSRVLGSEDYIVDGVDGLVVAPENPDELRAAITRVVSTPGLSERLGRAALEQVGRFHTLDQYVRNLIAVAEGLHAGRVRGQN
jgi:glycosyltransferase involved in cell wall biosynthesis